MLGRGGDGGGFPRRLQRGSLLGERGLFDSGIRAADVVALTDGYVATMLYSEIELLGDAYPELMRKFNLQLAKAALEDKLADTGMTLSDLGDSQLQEQLHALFKKQQRGQWNRIYCISRRICHYERPRSQWIDWC